MGVHSDVLPITTVDDYAENVLFAADQPARGGGPSRSSADQQEPAIRIQVDPGQDREPRHRARRNRQHHQHRNGRWAQRLDPRQAARFHHLRQRPDPERGAVERRDRALHQWRASSERIPRAGKYNIRITAGIETTIARPDWVEGLNRMNSNFVTSNHAKKVFQEESYAKIDEKTKQVIPVKN